MNDKGKEKNITFYENDIKTAQAHNINLNIKIIKEKLCISCLYKNCFITKTFSNNYSLDELKSESKYFKIFDNLEEILDEFVHNVYKNKEYIEGNEDTSKEIILVFPIPIYKIKNIKFKLKEEKKSLEKEVKELRLATNYYKSKLTIDNFTSKILNNDEQKENFKLWISKNKKLKANLLYSFYDLSYDISKNIINKEFKNEVINFHKKCDNKKNILLICKSKDEIFGGFTPASFDTSGKYEFDPNSFLFSINKSKKYDIFLENSSSIYCHENFGPSFHEDLNFIENKMNVIKCCKKSYNTGKNWINIENCFYDSDKILLDSLEIFQIVEEEDINYKSDEEQGEEEIYDNDVNENNIDNNSYNNDVNNSKSKINNHLDNNKIFQEISTKNKKNIKNLNIHINQRNKIENINESVSKVIKSNESENSSFYDLPNNNINEGNSNLINKMDNDKMTEIRENSSEKEQEDVKGKEDEEEEDDKE